MYTYAQLLGYVQAYKQLISYTTDDGSVRSNYFGEDTYKIAKMLKVLTSVEQEFTNFRDDIIKKHNPNNDQQVSDDVRRDIERDYGFLLGTEVIGFDGMIRLDYNALMSTGNRIPPATIAALYDYIDNLPE